MGHKKNSLSLLFELLKLVITLGLEEYVTNRQGLIDNENLRVNIYGYCKGKTHEHTA